MNRSPLIRLLAELLVDQIEREEAAHQIAEPRMPAQNSNPNGDILANRQASVLATTFRG